MTTNVIADANRGCDDLGCIVCGGKKMPCLSESNIHFLKNRISDGNLDEAIDLSRIGWSQFPRLKQAAGAGGMIEYIMESLQEKMNTQVLTPIANSSSAMSAIISRLEDLVKSNPSLIESGFNRTLEGFRLEIGSIRSAIQEPSARISELNQLVNQLIYKPIAKGNAGESILIDVWTEFFTRDQVDKLGGAGREDILVRPYMGENGAAHFGEAISVERKTGKQKYTGSHREEAIRHAKEKGASTTMLIYDNPENLPQSIRPVSISREQGILVIVSDLQSGTWKLMRETVEIVQREMKIFSKGISEINIDSIQEVVTELGGLIRLIEQVKGNNVKIKLCAEEVEQSVVTIKALVNTYQERLHRAINSVCKVNGEDQPGKDANRR